MSRTGRATARPDRRPPGGCDFAEDPALDARDADPAWLPDPDALIGLGPAVRDDDDAFSLWAIPGRKSIVHDGRRLLVRSRLGRRVVRLAVSLTLGDGQPYAYALPPGRRARERAAATVDLAEAIAGAPSPSTAGTVTRPMLVHMRTIHALDAKRAGASDREIAESALGATETDVSWNDSAARAQVRYLLRRPSTSRRRLPNPAASARKGGEPDLTGGSRSPPNLPPERARLRPACLQRAAARPRPLDEDGGGCDEPGCDQAPCSAVWDK